MPVNPKKPLIPVPALETTGIGAARIGTAIWALILVVSAIWPNSSDGLHYTALAGTGLGIIGQLHLTRRAKKLQIAVQGRFPR